MKNLIAALGIVFCGLVGPAAACDLAAKPDWSAAEAWTWARICAGETADLRIFSGNNSPMTEIETWPKTRHLGARFLTEILSDPAYAAAIPYAGLRILGARFPEGLDLPNVRIDRFLLIGQSVFDLPVNFRQIRSVASIDLNNSWFRWLPSAETEVANEVAVSVEFSESVIEGGLFLNQASFGALSLVDASIGLNLTLQDSLGTGDLLLTRSRIAGSAFLDRLDLEGDLYLTNARIDGDLSFGAARIAAKAAPADQPDAPLAGGGIFASNLRLGGSLFLGPGTDRPGIAGSEGAMPTQCQANAGASEQNPPAATEEPRFRARSLTLLGAEIGGELAMRQVAVEGEIMLQDVEVADDLWLTTAEAGSVNLSGAKIGGFLLLMDLRDAGAFNADSMQIGHALWTNRGTEIAGYADFSAGIVAGSTEIKGACFLGDVKLDAGQIVHDLRLSDGTEIKGNLAAGFLTIGGSLDMTGGKFVAVDLTGTTIGSELRLATEHKRVEIGTALSLRNVKADSLQDLPEAWPETVDLVNFTYQHLGGSRAEDGEAALSIDNREAAALIDWLARQKTYSPQPYAQLAGVLRQSGAEDKARAILFAAKERERAEAAGGEAFWLALQYVFTGYGLYTYVSGLWVIALVAIGYVVFSFDTSPQIAGMSRIGRAIYSLDMLLPIVHLRHNHQQIDLESWPKYYLYFHKLMGYFMATLLITSLTGAKIGE